MNKYGLLYIIASDVAEEKREELIAKFSSYVEAKGGTVEGIDKWGMRKLAYPIQKKNEGYYVVIEFKANPTLPKELDRRMRISDNIMRHLIINKDAK